MNDQIIEKIGKIGEDRSEQPQTQKIEPNRDYFESLMQQSTENQKTQKVEALQASNTDEATRNSLMDEVKNANSSTSFGNTSAENLVAQAQSVVTQIENIKQTLATPNLQIQNSVQTLLKSKLEHVDENLKVALDKMGSTEYKTPGELSGLGTPLERFIGFLSHSQYNLDHIANDVNAMALNGKELSPASLLAIQIKVNYVQQELEFFTNLLNKALESTKTIMNVQV